MKKKLLALLTGCMIIMGTITPAYASSFTLGNYNGSNTLTKSTNSATGKTSFAVGYSPNAYRYVGVTIKYTINGKSYTKSGSDSASTNPSNGYSKTTASVTVKKPGNGSMQTASSSHKTSYENKVKSEYLTK